MRVSHILAIQPIDDGLRALRRAHTDATAYAALVEKARYRYRALHCLLDAAVGFQKVCAAAPNVRRQASRER